MSVAITFCDTGRWHSACRASLVGRRAIWTHAIIWASEPTCTVALAAIRPVRIGGGAVPVAIFQCFAWRRDAAVFASVTARTVTITAVHRICVIGRAMTIAAQVARHVSSARDGWNGTIVASVVTRTVAVASICFVVVVGGSVVAAVDHSITGRRH